ncbi:MAG: sigE 19 [Gemmataceae bacterium]|nr:sigE 19 [Gemmataceae bacterium]
MNWLTRRLLAGPRPTHADGTDDRLLGAFVERRDGDAFETLVRRHGPMVWGVCRRITGRREDAEDAFQAVFLVLARKAPAVSPRAMLAGWLHGVAFRAAWQARRTMARRRAIEQPVARMPEPVAPAPVPAPDTDLAAVIDEEVNLLPDRYRLPVILCVLEGLTRREAAARLGWPEGSVAGRLDRARKLLAGRLARRGVGPAAAVGMAALADGMLPASLAAAAVRTTTDAGAISFDVAALTEGVLRTMIWTKTKWVAAVVLTTGLGLTGVGVFGQRSSFKPVEPSGAPILEPPPAPVKQATAAIRDLQKARLEALTKLADLLEKSFLAGLGTTVSEMVEARRQAVEVELELCDKVGDRVAVLERWVAAGKRLEEMAVRMRQAGSATEVHVLAARAARLQAEIALARSREPGQPDRVGRIIVEGKIGDDLKIMKLLGLYPGQVLPYPALEEARKRLEKAYPNATNPPEIVVEIGDPASRYKDIVVRVSEPGR